MGFRRVPSRMPGFSSLSLEGLHNKGAAMVLAGVRVEGLRALGLEICDLAHFCLG